MENPFTAHGKGRVFPISLQTGFPQLRYEGRLYTFPQRLLLRQIIPSDPIQTIKKVSKIHPFLLCMERGRSRWEIIMPTSQKANIRDLFAVFQP